MLQYLETKAASSPVGSLATGSERRGLGASGGATADRRHSGGHPEHLRFRLEALSELPLGKALFLDGRDPRADQEEILGFVAHKAPNSHNAHSFINAVMYAQRFRHLMARKSDPLENKPLVKIAMEGISRCKVCVAQDPRFDGHAEVGHRSTRPGPTTASCWWRSPWR